MSKEQNKLYPCPAKAMHVAHNLDGEHKVKIKVVDDIQYWYVVKKG